MPTSTVPAASGKNELRRELGLTSATAAVAGESIAVGIFLTPAGMAKSLGSPFWLLVVWLVLIGVRSPREALFGALVLATGLPVYEFFRRRSA